MCDYSLQGLPNRLAAEGEELVAHRFLTTTIGFTSPQEAQAIAEARATRKQSGFWAAAAVMMLDYDCGALPVVNDENKLIGMITDRDIAIAAATKARLASEIPVSEVISRKVYSAMPDEDVHVALKMMRHEKIRRLPIVNRDGALQGILSLNDVALRAEEEKGRRHPELTYEDAMSAVKAICEHRQARRAMAA